MAQIGDNTADGGNAGGARHSLRAGGKRGGRGARGAGKTGRIAQKTAFSASGRGVGASAFPQRAPHVGVGASAALELVAGAGGEVGLLGALLELVGTEHLTLGHTLAAWQREQDRLANRAWRRPGGLARPAGL